MNWLVIAIYMWCGKKYFSFPNLARPCCDLLQLRPTLTTSSLAHIGHLRILCAPSMILEMSIQWQLMQVLRNEIEPGVKSMEFGNMRFVSWVLYTKFCSVQLQSSDLWILWHFRKVYRSNCLEIAVDCIVRPHWVPMHSIQEVCQSTEINTNGSHLSFLWFFLVYLTLY
jgi:hypothetical protein